MLQDTSPQSVGVYTVVISNDTWSDDVALGSGLDSGLLILDTVADTEGVFVTFIFQVIDQDQLDVVYVIKVCTMLFLFNFV